MALERRPLPVLEGKAAEDFRKSVENFKETKTPEEIREINSKWRLIIEEAERRVRKEL
jgi:hypothetical protein